MRGDPSSRNRSVLLTRWRGALRVVREPELALPATVPPAPPPAPPPAQVTLTVDDAALFEAFEAEIRSSVAPKMAEAILRLLAATRAAVLAERSVATCTASLIQLDLVEDVLDAVLLADRGSAERAPGGQRPQ